MPKRVDLLPSLRKALSTPDGSTNPFIEPEPPKEWVKLEHVTAPPKRKSRAKTEVEWLSRSAAGEMLGVSRNATIGAMIQDGSLKTVMVRGHTRITRASVEALLERGWEPTPKPAKARAKRPKAPAAAPASKAKKIRFEDPA